MSRVLVGVIGAPHGVRGEVRVKSFTEDPLDLGSYGPVATEDGRSLDIERVRPAKEVVVVRFRGVDDRDAAEALKNKKLYVAREKLPPPDDADEFYHADLVGLPVTTPDGTALGTITALPDFGAGPLLEIKPALGGPTVLLAFTKANVPEVDLATRKVIVVPPAGTFDEE